MLKKILSVTLVVVLTNLVGISSAHARSSEEKEARFVEKIKDGVSKLGTGEAARIKVRLKDKTKVEGYISEADDVSFVVVDAKTGYATRVTYPQVKSVKGNNHSTMVDIAIGVSIVAAIVLMTLFYVSQTK
jgi:hypothetical protein